MNSTVSTLADTPAQEVGPVVAPTDADALGTSVRTTPAYFWVLLAALALNIFNGHWGDMGIPLPPDRVLMAGGLLLLALDRRGGTLRRPAGSGALTLAMIVYMACTAFSMIWWGQTDSKSVYAALDRVVMPLLLFLAAPTMLRTAFQRLVFLRTMSLVGLYLSLTTLIESVGAYGLLVPRYIASYKVNPDLVANGEAARAAGPFLSGEANGMVLLCCAAFAFLLARSDRSGWRFLGFVVGPLAAAASILTLTRSVWLGLFLAVAVVIGSRRALWRWLPLMAVVAVVLAVMGVAAMPDVVQNITERGSTSRSLYDRANSNAAALRVVADSPLTGVGWARFIKVAPDWVRQADTIPVTTVNIEIHNVFLSRMAELGIPVALLFVAILVAGPGAAVLRRRADPLEDDWRLAGLALGLVWLVPAMTSPVPYPTPTFLIFLLAGLLYAWPRVPSLWSERPDPERFIDGSEGSRPVPA